jgi:hypothetical protein
MILPVWHWQFIDIVSWIAIVPVIEIIIDLAISFDTLFCPTIKFIVVFLHFLLVIRLLEILLFKAQTGFS